MIPSHLPAPFGSYELLSPLGRGGMGEVFLARREGIEGISRLCVLKTLRRELASDREYVGRFLDEARIVTQLGHANICSVFDVGIVDGTYYLAMDYIAGTNLRELIEASHRRGQGIERKISTYIVSEVLDALDYAHNLSHPLTGEPLQLVHRDVSPHNVMVGFDGACRLIDFGLAASSIKQEDTASDVVLGKIAYMAPEQARGQDATPASDQFAVGVMLYELLADERFYGQMSLQRIWLTIGESAYHPPKLALLGPPFADLVARATAFHPDDRFESCESFRRAIDDARDQARIRGDRRDARALVQRVCDERIESERALLKRFSGADRSGVDRIITGQLQLSPEELAELGHTSASAPRGGAEPVLTVSDSRALNDGGLGTESDSRPLDGGALRTTTDSRVLDGGELHTDDAAADGPVFLERTESASRSRLGRAVANAATTDASARAAVASTDEVEAAPPVEAALPVEAAPPGPEFAPGPAFSTRENSGSTDRIDRGPPSGRTSGGRSPLVVGIGGAIAGAIAILAVVALVPDGGPGPSTTGPAVTAPTSPPATDVADPNNPAPSTGADGKAPTAGNTVDTLDAGPAGLSDAKPAPADPAVEVAEVVDAPESDPPAAATSKDGRRRRRRTGTKEPKPVEVPPPVEAVAPPPVVPAPPSVDEMLRVFERCDQTCAPGNRQMLKQMAGARNREGILRSARHCYAQCRKGR